MTKAPYMYFLAENGTPCDEGSRQLAEQSFLPKFKN